MMDNVFKILGSLDDKVYDTLIRASWGIANWGEKKKRESTIRKRDRALKQGDAESFQEAIEEMAI
jgi:hypothetical protein